MPPRASKPSRTLLGSLGCALSGLGHAVMTQRNLRLHLLAAWAAVAASWWLGVGRMEWMVVGVLITLVLVAELLNTAVEVLVDLVSPDRRQQAMLIKDIAAGAVLVCCVSAVVVGSAAVWPYLLRRS